jgi:DnaJ family protein C protein 13
MYNCCVVRYKRIFSIGSMAISTYNPTSLELTNQWFYNDFVSICPVLKGTCQQNNEFKITFKKDRKNDTMTFSSDYRADILTEAHHFRQLFAEKTTTVLVSFTWYVAINLCNLSSRFFVGVPIAVSVY